jgi:hypothetical protein
MEKNGANFTSRVSIFAVHYVNTTIKKKWLVNRRTFYRVLTTNYITLLLFTHQRKNNSSDNTIEIKFLLWNINFVWSHAAVIKSRREIRIEQECHKWLSAFSAAKGLLRVLQNGGFGKFEPDLLIVSLCNLSNYSTAFVLLTIPFQWEIRITGPEILGFLQQRPQYRSFFDWFPIGLFYFRTRVLSH